MLCIAYGAKIIFVIAGLPLNVPFIRNDLFCLKHTSNRAIVVLDVVNTTVNVLKNTIQIVKKTVNVVNKIINYAIRL